jgi:asparagine N-glycosylation enzyme membrane subunit Stt3
MQPKSIHRFARLATTVLTISAAAFGAFFGVVASGWGGIFVIVPVCAAVFGVLGALIGGAIEGAIRLRHPFDYEL